MRGTLAVAVVLALVALASFAILPACPRCAQDNAYLGLVLYPLALAAVAGLFLLASLFGRRRAWTRRAATIGALIGIGCGAVLFTAGVTRILPGGPLDLAIWAFALAGSFAAWTLARR
ncbi:MAG TPA: hypothetical protein VFM93_10200 [Candidatus Limnocylindria bacterium]|nr:hypothetical protein [Candidatus Limnocylindria bacterium]